MIRVHGPAYKGMLTISGDTVRYSYGKGFWNGTVTLVQEGRGEYLRFMQDNPAMLWIECERTR